MEFVVIAYSLAAFMLVVLIAAPFGLKADHKAKRIEAINKNSDTAVYKELELSFYDRYIKKAVKKITSLFNRFLPKRSNANQEKKNELLQKQLRLAGMFVDASDYVFVKNLYMIIVITITAIVFLVLDIEMLYKLLIFCIGLLLAVMGPTLYLRSRVSSHQTGIKKQLPDAMDMISVCIEAGLSFDSALLKVSEKLKGPFIDELLIVHREIKMGRTRREALQNLCSASTVEELKTFASALAQAEQLGIPINNVMKAQSVQLRVTRSQEAKAKGMKASIKMLIPILIFIFPVVFIILMGPTVMNIIDTF